jgi:hypothetical protein
MAFWAGNRLKPKPEYLVKDMVTLKVEVEVAV